MATSQHFDCAVIGDWHLAFVTAASLASLDHRVVLVSPQPNHESQTLPAPPVHEPGLVEVMQQAQSKGNLCWLRGVSAAWKADTVWLAIDTPVNEHDEADTSLLEKMAAQIHQHQNAHKAFIIGSQIPLGFSRKIAAHYHLPVVVIPENLRLGSGLDTFLNADRTVIGADTPALQEHAKQLLSGVKTELLFCDLPTAEMIKHATNAFLATSISFANECARVGEAYGVDNQLVGKALKMDKRIGPRAYVEPGLGFAGATLARDLKVLQTLAKKQDQTTPLIDAVLNINNSTSQALLTSIKNHCLDLKGKKILIVGYTYKPDTDTLRRSLSVELARALSKANATVWGFDPPMNGRDLSEFQRSLTHFSSWSEIPQTPDVVVVMTPRKEFATLDWTALSHPGSQSQLILDTRHTVCKSDVLRAGFSYKALWQPTVLPVNL